MDLSYIDGVLKTKPAAPAEPLALAPGTHPMGLPGERPGGLLYVPPNYLTRRTSSLLVLLHGAGGTARSILPPFLPLAARRGTLLISLNSNADSWDVVRGGYGPDVQAIDDALRQVFQSFSVDPAHIAIAGFADGASYALSLGLINGSLFSHIVAIAPGFIAPTRIEDPPRLFIAHGTDDQVLPIDQCSREMATDLRLAGYDLLYCEFHGGHIIPAPVVELAFGWFFGNC